jgi:hypothetical protein
MVVRVLLILSLKRELHGSIVAVGKILEVTVKSDKWWAFPRLPVVARTR